MVKYIILLFNFVYNIACIFFWRKKSTDEGWYLNGSFPRVNGFRTEILIVIYFVLPQEAQSKRPGGGRGVLTRPIVIFNTEIYELQRSGGGVLECTIGIVFIPKTFIPQIKWGVLLPFKSHKALEVGVGADGGGAFLYAQLKYVRHRINCIPKRERGRSFHSSFIIYLQKIKVGAFFGSD